MQLIQIFLPLYDNGQQPIAETHFQTVRKELVEKFGGLTAHTSAPLEGLWKDDPDHTTRDDMVIFEVMAEDLDKPWWQSYRQQLEVRFKQEQVLIRAQHIEVI
jgi:hypothetical protein